MKCGIQAKLAVEFGVLLDRAGMWLQIERAANRSANGYLTKRAAIAGGMEVMGSMRGAEWGGSAEIDKVTRIERDFRQAALGKGYEGEKQLCGLSAPMC